MQSVRVNDTTNKRKTAENLLEDIEEVYKELCKTWATIVVGLVTDAAGDARKAHRLFALKHPSVIVIDCYAHQVDLHKLNATPVLILIA